TQFRAPGIWARSILSLGHGVGLHRIDASDITRPKLHLSQGAVLGDAGYIDKDGGFFYCFNLFYPSIIPFNEIWCQRLHPPLSAQEVRTFANRFPPGTVMATEGIEVSQESDSPLKLDFVASAREGAVLVLPTGASHEEIIDPSRIYLYVKEHDVSWYQRLSGDSNDFVETPIPNGMLRIVTGVDRATYDMATFQTQEIYGNTETQMRFRYTQENSQSAWEGKSQAGPLLYNTGSFSDDGTRGAVPLNVISVALSPSQWSRHAAHILPRSVRNCQPLLRASAGISSHKGHHKTPFTR
ncbi:hypothetical protein BDZ97DRAFT_1781003, partial [Flammula alnicola]